ncbi:hypothetical protein COB21_00915 [Candidatus Aerophobetes bacterium]|uniref:Uncharacterized protein n=1 Tax=Aerophobetes bacterium TaxID=2030807 RepID=A0A2A4X8N0_UNCAE|nr:MAG: hypothetical protein COB21_00915 [Candidatus Aerophobetes bacterium]
MRDFSQIPTKSPLLFPGHLWPGPRPLGASLAAFFIVQIFYKKSSLTDTLFKGRKKSNAIFQQRLLSKEKGILLFDFLEKGFDFI